MQPRKQREGWKQDGWMVQNMSGGSGSETAHLDEVLARLRTRCEVSGTFVKLSVSLFSRQ